jgi:hypothetical protein
MCLHDPGLAVSGATAGSRRFQPNGRLVRFQPAGWLQLITEYKIGIGLSLDGPAQLG